MRGGGGPEEGGPLSCTLRARGGVQKDAALTLRGYQKWSAVP